MQQLFLLALVLACFISCTIAGANFYNCPNRDSESENITVEISDCEDGASLCNLKRGHSYDVKLFFTPKKASNARLERLIFAKFSKNLRGRSVEAKYGKAVRMDDAIYSADDDQKLGTRMLEAGKLYYHLDSFHINEAVPKRELLVRYLIRSRASCKSKVRCSYELHPGDAFVCIEIPVSVS